MSMDVAMGRPTDGADGSMPGEVAHLAPFVTAGVLGDVEVHLAATVARLAGEVPGVVPDGVLLGAALAMRAVRLGHTCLHLSEAPLLALDLPEADRGDPDDTSGTGLPWPAEERWREELGGCPDVVADPEGAERLPLRPLVLEGDRLYLHRYWRYERLVAGQLRDRAVPVDVDPAAVDAAVEAAFGAPRLDDHGAPVPDLQREAVARALGSHLSVIAGGPGTGKTTTVARFLAALAHLGTSEDRTGSTAAARVALAAPTGKAAARMTEAVAGALGGDEPVGSAPVPGEGIEPATTIHRLLGWAPGTEFRHHADNPLDADVVVIDETSMVDLSLMAHLLDAVRPDARLVLVGDPHQLASVQAGTVLGDVVEAAGEPGSPLHASATMLTRIHRFEEDSAIAGLADAIRTGDAERTVGLLAAAPAGVSGVSADMDLQGPAGPEWLRWVEEGDDHAIDNLTGELAEVGVGAVEAARRGDGALALSRAAHAKTLAATRRGPLGLHAWTDRIEAAVADAVDTAAAPGTTALRRGERWFVGKPVLVTANNPVLRVANGDVGVVVASSPDGAAGTTSVDRAVAARLDGELRHLAPTRLDHTEPWWAMTIHKSQGSEFPHVVVSLPHASSRILTRELLYTAVTRARRSVTVVGSEAAIRVAVERPVARASGLAERLAG